MFEYHALCTKCRAIRSDFLTEEDYRALACCDRLEKALDRLAGYPGYRALAASDGVLHRSDAETILRREYFTLYDRLISFSAGAVKDFFALLIEKYEIEYLMRALRAVTGGVRERYAAIPDCLRRRHTMDFPALCRATDYGALTDALRGTAYHREAIAYLSGTPDPEGLEDALFYAYYDRLYGAYCDRLDPPSAAAVRALIEQRADAENAARAARVVRYGFRVGSHTFLPHGSARGKAYVREILDGAAPPPDPQSGKRALFDYCSHLLSAGEFHMGVPAATLLLARFELENLTYVIEGIRYGVGQDAIMEKIICR